MAKKIKKEYLLEYLEAMIPGDVLSYDPKLFPLLREIIEEQADAQIRRNAYFQMGKLLRRSMDVEYCRFFLARLEQEGKLSAVVTQNIDGLHQKAGSKKVYELHGSVLRNYCTRCRKFHSAEFVRDCDGVPKCSCGGTVKPDVVLYEENLDTSTIEKSVAAIRKADLLIVAGTSLTVYPAAGLIHYYQGNRLVLINRDATPYDHHADLVFHESLGNIFKHL